MKKREVKPFIEVRKKNVMAKLSFLTGVSIKQIGEDLCQHAIDSDFEISLVPYFKRSVRIKNSQFAAYPNPKPFPQNKSKVERISLMLDPQIYDYAYNISYATEISVPKIVASMIHYSMEDKNFFDEYVFEYLGEQITQERKELLKSIMGDINGRFNRDYSVAALLFYIADERKNVENTFVENVDEFVDRWTAT